MKARKLEAGCRSEDMMGVLSWVESLRTQSE